MSLLIALSAVGHRAFVVTMAATMKTITSIPFAKFVVLLTIPMMLALAFTCEPIQGENKSMSKKSSKSTDVALKGAASKSETINKSENSKENKTMSTTEKTAPATTETDNTFEKTFKFIDLATMKDQKVTKTVTFVPAADFKSALERLSSVEKGEEKATSAVNTVLRDVEIQNVRKASVPANAAPRNVVLDFIKPYRNGPTFAKLMEIDGKVIEKGDKRWKPLYDAQTESVLDAIKDIPFIMEQLKGIAASASFDGDETETEEKSE